MAKLSESSHQSFIAPEDIETGAKYALTVNPDEQLYMDKKQVEMHKANMSDFFKYHLFAPHYKFYLERSNTGRLHYHGWVKFDSFEQIDNFYKLLTILKDRYIMTYKFGDYDEILRSELGPTPHNFVPKYPTWLDYCKKQVRYWNQVGIFPVLCSTDVATGKKLVFVHKVDHDMKVEAQKKTKSTKVANKKKARTYKTTKKGFTRKYED